MAIGAILLLRARWSANHSRAIVGRHVGNRGRVWGILQPDRPVPWVSQQRELRIRHARGHLARVEDQEVAGFQGKEGLRSVWFDAHRVDEEIAVIGTAAVTRSRIEGVIGLVGSGKAVIPVASRDLRENTFPRLADIGDYQVRVGIDEDVWGGEKQ